MPYKSKIRKNKYIKNQTKKIIKGGQPSLASNASGLLNLASQLGNNMVAFGIQKGQEGIDKISDVLHIDTTVPITETIDKLKNTVTSEKGMELLGNLGTVIKEVEKTVVEPAIEEGITEVNNILQKEIPVVGDMVNKAVLEIPVVGQGIALVGEGMDVAQSAENAVEGVAKLSTTGTNAFGKLKEKQNMITSAVNNVKSLFSNGIENLNNNVTSGLQNLNNNVASGLQNLKANVDKQGNSVQEQINKSTQLPTLKTPIVTGGSRSRISKKSLKRIQSTSKKIFNRTVKSQIEFFSPRTIKHKLK